MTRVALSLQNGSISYIGLENYMFCFTSSEVLQRISVKLIGNCSLNKFDYKNIRYNCVGYFTINSQSSNFDDLGKYLKNEDTVVFDFYAQAYTVLRAKFPKLIVDTILSFLASDTLRPDQREAMYMLQCAPAQLRETLVHVVDSKEINLPILENFDPAFFKGSGINVTLLILQNALLANFIRKDTKSIIVSGIK